MHWLHRRWLGLTFGALLVCIPGCVSPAARAPGWVAVGPPFDSPACDVAFEHLALDVAFDEPDFEARRMRGLATYRIRAARDGVRWLMLDAVGLQFDNVEIGPKWRAARHVVGDGYIAIDLGRSLRRDEAADVRLSYRVENPATGLYFVRRGNEYVVYTHDEAHQGRHWLPCHNWPDTRFASCEVSVRAPTGYRAASVGRLVEFAPLHGGGTISRWRIDQPLDTHMFGFALGRFERIALPPVQRDGATPLPISIFARPADIDAARERLDDAGAVIRFYSERIGEPYPFPEYSHVLVPGHFHGGMEHAGFDMVAPEALRSLFWGERARYDYVAHMIAHHWFGAMVNFRDFRHAWLNEGFATYLHTLWLGHRTGEERLQRELRSIRGRVIAGDRGGRSAPLVNAEIRNPNDAYGFAGGAVYFRGAWVLRMLADELGEDVFWAGVRRYLREHRWGSVTTDDLRAALERASGRDLSDFFAQWVYRGGVPHVRVAWRYVEESRVVMLRVAQTQLIDPQRPPFRFMLDVRIDCGEYAELHRVPVRAADETFELSWDAAAPTAVVLDPDVRLLGSLEVKE